MFLKERKSGDLVDIVEMKDLTDLFTDSVVGRYQAGEEQQDPEPFKKSDLVFMSGEELPRCWTDPGYRSHKVRRR
ncbi:acetyltransferase [Vibrio sp. SCSIO 43137]|uniref:acetyltransferase n=1 Tax=Vibrio sp. SCSIO 43137 TaxID=3021011 RepID=UPI00230814B1|nr:acetyltransferase [Vibrio sp. SCSIO 43137]WCE30740.1 acetyltransferase [Vibrio sp. SCSIO 43137]